MSIPSHQPMIQTRCSYAPITHSLSPLWPDHTGAMPYALYPINVTPCPYDSIIRTPCPYDAIIQAPCRYHATMLPPCTYGPIRSWPGCSTMLTPCVYTLISPLGAGPARVVGVHLPVGTLRGIMVSVYQNLPIHLSA